MSHPPNPAHSNAGTFEAPTWADPQRQAHFDQWLQSLSAAQLLLPSSLAVASADASFRRYFRIQSALGSRIIMDAPPALENNAAFVHIAGMMAKAGLLVPQVLNWQTTHGFLLLTDLGLQTMLQQLDLDNGFANQAPFGKALDALCDWQQVSQEGLLPAYDHPLLMRELQLFPDWYVAQHRGVHLSEAETAQLQQLFALIATRNLALPKVFVHRDFMPRNLMVPIDTAEQRLGVLDFQDAVYGPITYDIASLMRDAFLSWDEDFVLDITIRFWEKARQRGLLGATEWSHDFGAFWREVEWMGLQRHLKVAGIFARLGLRDHKPKYLADTPRFIHYIRATANRYRELGPLLKLMDRIEGTSAPVGFAYGRM